MTRKIVEIAQATEWLVQARLNHVCRDMAARGILTLYLLTDHIGFYERYGWEFHCMVQGDGDPEPSRMYVHRTI